MDKQEEIKWLKKQIGYIEELIKPEILREEQLNFVITSRIRRLEWYKKRLAELEEITMTKDQKTISKSLDIMNRWLEIVDEVATKGTMTEIQAKEVESLRQQLGDVRSEQVAERFRNDGESDG